MMSGTKEATKGPNLQNSIFGEARRMGGEKRNPSKPL
jgi:hypothetical protein